MSMRTTLDMSLGDAHRPSDGDGGGGDGGGGDGGGGDGGGGDGGDRGHGCWSGNNCKGEKIKYNQNKRYQNTCNK